MYYGLSQGSFRLRGVHNKPRYWKFHLKESLKGLLIWSLIQFHQCTKLTWSGSSLRQIFWASAEWVTLIPQLVGWGDGFLTDHRSVITYTKETVKQNPIFRDLPLNSFVKARLMFGEHILCSESIYKEWIFFLSQIVQTSHDRHLMHYLKLQARILFDPESSSQ